jgi:excisionase family DNA binding protein
MLCAMTQEKGFQAVPIYVGPDIVALRLGMTRKRVLRLAREGKIPGKRVPGTRTWLFDEAQVLSKLVSNNMEVANGR